MGLIGAARIVQGLCPPKNDRAISWCVHGETYVDMDDPNSVAFWERVESALRALKERAGGVLELTDKSTGGIREWTV